MTDNRRPRFPFRPIGILLTAALAVAVIWLLPGWLQPQQAAEQRLVSGNQCDLTRASCIASAGEQSMTLTLAPTPISSKAPLQVEVAVAGFATDQILLTLEGRDMFMGINQFPLRPVDGQPDLWRGEAELAACTSGEMRWQARLSAATLSGTTEATFEFSAR